MGYTLDQATAEHVTGRVIGEGGRFIAVTETAAEPDGARYILAVRRDGGEYVTWCAVPDGDKIAVYWGHYFHVGSNAFAAFEEATADLAARADVSAWHTV